ncbi:MAG: accessory factor UbiK family protein [Gammaproteobacteria bacterium]|nr:accessory factor UbiK family protein [Gammaproteobacteria bacterium]
MLDPKLLKELTEKLKSNLPVEEINKSFELILEQAISKLNLVSRKQFDIQTKVLAEAVQELEYLNKKIAQLEAQK